MKVISLQSILLILLLSCNAPSNEKPKKEKENQPKKLVEKVDNQDILYRVKTTNKEDLEIFTNGIIPWISIKEPENYIDQLIGRDEIVLKQNEAILMIDYPLRQPIEIKIQSKDKEGFRRGELILQISQEYKRIYKEEEVSAKTKTIPLEKREGIINRNQTDGAYGIWGHDIEDLDLSRIFVHFRKNELPLLELYIES